MALSIATPVANSMMNQITVALDADVEGPGAIRVYDGAKPTNADTALSGQTLLAEFVLADPSFAAPAARAIAIDAEPVLSTVGLAAGDAAWFRAVDNSGDTVLDGTVSTTGNDGDLQLTTTAVSVGLTLEITGGSFTLPA